ncbi:methionyl-tRNA formyltransferase [Gracilibacillus halotolerans]|uniref:Methionyl-tRNA formyltransferase n=1 Tax=Gracilibacillus halotolerans TaxID=74386 RepID=A0A841RH75_9BACI|nr:methionyl-tRNA formyltransferase [Gracilibacillus halotolerans]MBB6511392.1 methionyl-tRNA formyltransferase [Gracilibacillus halotolerans]
MKKSIVFMGTPDFAVPVLEALIDQQYKIDLVVTQPDRPKGRKKQLTPPPVKVAAEQHGIPIFQPEKIKNDWGAIKEVNPDLIITAAFGQILPKELLDFPSKGCINVHASLLPKLRGGAPIHYSIIEGHKETGISIMYMTEKLDAGDIISQQAIPIEEKDNVGTLHDKLAKVGSELLIRTLPDFLNGNIDARKQEEAEVTYAPNIKREDERIDWSREQEVIFNQIRGLCPWPVAFTQFEGKTMKVWQAEKSDIISDKEPGTIHAIEADGILIVTGSRKTIKITELQPAGKKRMQVEDFLRGAGNTLTVGAKFGE